MYVRRDRRRGSVFSEGQDAALKTAALHLNLRGFGLESTGHRRRPVPHLRRWVRLGDFSQPLRSGLTCAAPTALGKTNAVGWTAVQRGRVGNPP
jgi:hypothetical protein